MRYFAAAAAATGGTSVRTRVEATSELNRQILTVQLQSSSGLTNAFQSQRACRRDDRITERQRE
jgi:hypothetical protein